MSCKSDLSETNTPAEAEAPPSPSVRQAFPTASLLETGNPPRLPATLPPLLPPSLPPLLPLLPRSNSACTSTEVCVVCLSDEPDSVHTLPCGHCCMCAHCVTQLLNMGRDRIFARCPLCREPFRRNEWASRKDTTTEIESSVSATSREELSPYSSVSSSELASLEPGVSVALLGIIHASELQSYRHLRERFLFERSQRLQQSIVSNALRRLSGDENTTETLSPISQSPDLQSAETRVTGTTNPAFRRTDLNWANEEPCLSNRGNTVLCPCGSVMSLVRAQEAYPASLGCPVECDLCNRAIRGTGGVFHCDGERNRSHPFGFDLCPGCALGEEVEVNSLESGVALGNGLDTTNENGSLTSSSQPAADTPSFRSLFFTRLLGRPSDTPQSSGRCLTQPNRVFGTVVNALVGGLSRFLMLPPRREDREESGESGGTRSETIASFRGASSVPLVRPRRRSLE